MSHSSLHFKYHLILVTNTTFLCQIGTTALGIPYSGKLMLLICNTGFYHTMNNEKYVHPLLLYAHHLPVPDN